ncbi:hypothetical protein ACL0VS_12025 [Chryseobacterium sp. PMSZPI]|uniref:hypothetical protein n=1 Tax=Chryseobacterium sp. PMSZPI TaxID=1033900 RepID=UPI0039A37D13
MKYILIILSITLSTYLWGQDNKIFSKVIDKLQNDERTFKQFAELGNLYCTDQHSIKRTNLFTDKYLALFNALYPFPRLINDNILKVKYKSFDQQYYTKKNKCSCIYSVKNKNLKTLYVKIVKDKKSYHDNKEYYLEEDMKDYLKDYMIDSSRFK